MNVDNIENNNIYREILITAEELRSITDILPNSFLLDDIRSQIIGIQFELMRADLVACMMLSTEKLVHQVNAISRSMLEKRFVIYALIKDEKNVDSFLEASKHETFRLQKRCRDLELLTNENNKLTQGEKSKNITIEQWSKKADLLYEYKGIYSVLSASVHSIGSMTSAAYKRSEAGQQIIDINHSEEENYCAFLTSCELLYSTFKTVCNYFHISYENNSFDERLRRCEKKNFRSYKQ